MGILGQVILIVVSAIVGSGGTGLIFYRISKSEKEAQASSAKAQADIDEDNAFSARISALAEQLKVATEEQSQHIARVRELNIYIEKLEDNVRELTKALSDANRLIEEKDECIRNLEEELRLQKEKNDIYSKRKAHTKSEVTRMKNNDKEKYDKSDKV